MSDSQTNYRAVNIPADTAPPDYSYTARRAEILQLIEEAGHPDSLNQSRLADRYDVARSTISRDFDRIREFIQESIGTHRHAISASVYRKAIKEFTERGDYDDAIDAVESWNEWLREEGVREVEPETERRELSGDGDGAPQTLEVTREVVTDDDDTDWDVDGTP